MSMRITTRSIMQGYNRNLNLALNRWNEAQNKVLTQRNFNTVAENPADANRSYNLRSQFRENSMQLEMTQQVQSLMDETVSVAMQISDIMANNVNPDIIKAINDTNSHAERQTYAETLRGYRDSILLSINTQVGGRYIYGGESTKEVPFELDENGNLFYRGVNVTNGTDKNGDPLPAGTLDALSKESLYIDMGFGLELNPADDPLDGDVISTSAFNSATPGINLLGYGETDGQPNNVVVLLDKMAQELDKEDFNADEFRKMMDHFQNNCLQNVTTYESELGTKQQFLDGTVTRLEQYNETINKRIVDIEQVDMPEAISTYTWMGYAYNAALKVGTDIVSNSLLDFMR